jgi:choline-glycine betaine transporter
MFSLAGKFLRHVLPGLVRPLHVLWNEIIGFIFLVLAAFILFSTVRRPHDNPGSFIMMLFGIGFGLMLVYFGLSSFRRARKISRS